MKRLLRNKLRMLLSVQAACKKHKGIWENVSNFADLYEEFDANLKKIGDEMTIQSSILDGKTENKSGVKQDLAKYAIIVIGILRGYAKSSGDAEIRAKVDVSESEISRGRDAEVLKFCEMVHQMADELTTELTDMGKDLTPVAQLKEKIDDFNMEIVAPRTAISRRSIATNRLGELFTATSRLLKDEMDAVVRTFEDDESGFVEEYSNARKIIDLKGNKTISEESDESEINIGSESSEVDFPEEEDKEAESSSDEAA